MKENWKKWTDEETELARAHYRDDVSPADFLRIVGRTKSIAGKRLAYVDNPERERARERKRQLERERIRKLESPPPQVDRNAPPPDVISEAIQRARAARSLTAALFGDPPPGFSALDRRNS